MEPETREETLRRLRSIEGHIRGVQRMLEEERSCVEVIRQTLAIRKALDRVSQLLVSSHLRSCLAAGMDVFPDDPRGRAIQDLLDALELSGHL